jgi:Peptidase inhibitor family I36
MIETSRARKRTAIAAGTAVAAGGATAALLMPAAAGASLGQCSGDRLCEWGNNGFSGCFTARGVSVDLDYRNDHYITCSTKSLHDDIDSVWNNTNRWVRFYDNVGGISGAKHNICFPPGSANSVLENLHLSGGPIVFSNGWGDDIDGHQEYTAQPSGCDQVAPNRQGCSY